MRLLQCTLARIACPVSASQVVDVVRIAAGIGQRDDVVQRERHAIVVVQRHVDRFTADPAEVWTLGLEQLDQGLPLRAGSPGTTSSCAGCITHGVPP